MLEMLDLVETAEASNLLMAKKAMGKLWPLASRVIKGYGNLADALLKIDSVTDDDWFVPSMFLRSAERAGALGMLNLARLHFTESWPQIRRAIEFGGFALLTWKRPQMATAWLLAGDNDESYEAYRKTFSAARLKHALRELQPKLAGDYDRASRMTHASLYSLAHAYEAVKTDDGDEHRLHYFDLRPGTARPLLSYALSHLRVHDDLQSALARRVLQGANGRLARSVWKRSHDEVVGRLRLAVREYGARLRGKQE